MLRALLLLLGFCILLGACTQKVVCPAYQSAFIYDKDELRKKFSYFKEDSTPKLATVKKTKYLIAEPTTFKKKTRSLQTVPAKPVNPVVPDSLLIDDDTALASELDAAARSVIDSTYIADVDAEPLSDSLAVEEDYVISVDREVRVLKYNFPDSLKYIASTGKYVPEKPSYYIKEVGFNVDQGNYLWYLRDVLVLPDVRLSKKAAKEEAEEAKKKKGIKGFFSNLFKKKSRKTEPTDSLQKVKSIDMDEFNYDGFDDSPAVDSTSSASAPQAKKKGLFSFLKKDKSAKKKAEPKPKKKDEPAVKKDEDDGF